MACSRLVAAMSNAHNTLWDRLQYLADPGSAMHLHPGGSRERWLPPGEAIVSQSFCPLTASRSMLASIRSVVYG